MNTLKYIVSIILFLLFIGLWMATDPEVDMYIKGLTKESVKHSKSIFMSAYEGWSEKSDSTVVK